MRSLEVPEEGAAVLEAVHGAGGKIMPQLWHAGISTKPDGKGIYFASAVHGNTGLYFIDQLLTQARASDLAARINWPQVENLRTVSATVAVAGTVTAMAAVTAPGTVTTPGTVTVAGTVAVAAAVRPRGPVAASLARGARRPVTWWPPGGVAAFADRAVVALG